MLLGEVFGINAACCRTKNQDSFVNLSIIINNAMTGQETEKAPFGFFTRNGKFVECLLSVSKKVDAEGMVTGVFCFIHIASHELQQVLQVQQLSEQTAMKKLKALAYIRHEIRNPLSGILFTRKMMEGTDLTEEQKQLLDTGTKCHRQINKILDDLDLDNIMDSCLDLEMAEFSLQDVVATAVSQVLVASQAKGIRITYDLSDRLMTEEVYGDNLRLQQIIADFLLVSVKYSPSGGHVEIAPKLIKDRLGETVHLVHLELRIAHTGSGIPEELLSHMFGNTEDPSRRASASSSVGSC
uniref:histidine kinase n=1 Tax=Ananas comosus var. bracteatus TaxID=296719 RepID=A0A6V7NE33_ANACO|nr:unnamed protein product [Ananas comosus var. bracteatus]